MRSRLAGLAIAACIAGLAGCGGGKDSDDYPAAAERNFTTACTKSSGGDSKGCRCALDKIEQKMSYKEFKREDAAINAGHKPSRAVTDAIADCVK